MFLSIKALKQFCMRKDKKFCHGDNKDRVISFMGLRRVYFIANFKTLPDPVEYLNRQPGFAIFITEEDMVRKLLNK